MQAYAPAEMAPAAELRLLQRLPTISDDISTGSAFGNGVLNELLEHMADLVAAKVAARLTAPQPDVEDDWLDTRHAAQYLGIHRDSVRRLAAERTIPSEQAAAGCKLFFRRSDLDAWRGRGSAAVVSIRSRRDG